MDDTHDDPTHYDVVVNHEEQYSIWAADLETPAGWRSVGVSGDRAQCLEWIGQNWTDMRPLSLRTRMDAGPGGATSC
ncbi:MbtH family protein [Streptomyces sp. NPDC003016]